MTRLVRGQERERDLRRLSLFTPQAGPERGIDDRGDRQRRRRVGDRGPIRGARRGDVPGEMPLDHVGDKFGGGVGGLKHLSIGC